MHDGGQQVRYPACWALGAGQFESDLPPEPPLSSLLPCGPSVLLRRIRRTAAGCFCSFHKDRLVKQGQTLRKELAGGCALRPLAPMSRANAGFACMRTLRAVQGIGGA